MCGALWGAMEDVAGDLLGCLIPDRWDPLRLHKARSFLVAAAARPLTPPYSQNWPRLEEIRILLLSIHTAIFRISQMPRNLAPAPKRSSGALALDNKPLFA